MHGKWALQACVCRSFLFFSFCIFGVPRPTTMHNMRSRWKAAQASFSCDSNVNAIITTCCLPESSRSEQALAFAFFPFFFDWAPTMKKLFFSSSKFPLHYNERCKKGVLWPESWFQHRIFKLKTVSDCLWLEFAVLWPDFALSTDLLSCVEEVITSGKLRFHWSFCPCALISSESPMLTKICPFLSPSWATTEALQRWQLVWFGLVMAKVSGHMRRRPIIHTNNYSLHYSSSCSFLTKQKFSFFQFRVSCKGCLSIQEFQKQGMCKRCATYYFAINNRSSSSEAQFSIVNVSEDSRPILRFPMLEMAGISCTESSKSPEWKSHRVSSFVHGNMRFITLSNWRDT